MFGEHVKKLRVQKDMGLREFCIALDFDPSNWSRIERGMAPPPQDASVLERIGVVLGVSGDQKAMAELQDLASIGGGRIPPYVLDDEEVVKKLPVFFRTISGKKPTEHELDKLVEILKKQ